MQFSSSSFPPFRKLRNACAVRPPTHCTDATETSFDRVVRGKETSDML